MQKQLCLFTLHINLNLLSELKITVNSLNTLGSYMYLYSIN
jgi:hypothetical protein